METSYLTSPKNLLTHGDCLSSIFWLKTKETSCRPGMFLPSQLHSPLTALISFFCIHYHSRKCSFQSPQLAGGCHCLVLSFKGDSSVRWASPKCSRRFSQFISHWLVAGMHMIFKKRDIIQRQKLAHLQIHKEWPMMILLVLYSLIVFHFKKDKTWKVAVIPDTLNLVSPAISILPHLFYYCLSKYKTHFF